MHPYYSCCVSIIGKPPVRPKKRNPTDRVPEESLVASKREIQRTREPLAKLDVDTEVTVYWNHSKKKVSEGKDCSIKSTNNN